MASLEEYCLTSFYPVLINGGGNAAEVGKETMVGEVRYDACLLTK